MNPAFLKSWRFWATCLLVPLGILLAGIFAQKFLATVAEPAPAVLAPDFTLPDLNGRPVTLADFRGRPVLVLFWTSWNEASLAEAASRSRNNPPATEIFFINSGEEEAEARKAAEEVGLPPDRVLLDSEGGSGSQYEIGVLPLTVFVDREGWVRRRAVGPIAEPIPRAWLREIGVEYN